jgi:hypothetical protein
MSSPFFIGGIMLAKMTAPEGCTSCSFDGKTFEVDSDGLVTVPVEAATTLMCHGFILAEFEPTEEDISAQEAKAIADAEAAEANRQKEAADAEEKKLRDAELYPAILEAEGRVERAKEALFSATDPDLMTDLAAVLEREKSALAALTNG